MVDETTPSPTDRDSAGRDAVDPGAPAAGLDRAAAIFDAFDEVHRELTLSALVRRSGLPRSTVHRTADRMIRLGWLDKPGDRYRVGTRIFELSGLVAVRRELREAALPFMQDLYVAAHTTVQLGVLEGVNILVVEKISGHRRMPMLSQVGSMIPAHCSALGRVILSHSDDATVDSVLHAGLRSRTANTITSEAAWRAELATIHARGWAADREEGNLAINCVAAPVFDSRGVVAAAISVTGPAALIRPERLAAAVQLAGAAASRAYGQRT
jgi:DNA-binding IclR family transcriptional regulator